MLNPFRLRGAGVARACVSVVLITLTSLPFTAPFAAFDWGTQSNDTFSHQRQSSFAKSRTDESGAELVLASNPASRIRAIALVASKLPAPQPSSVCRAFTAAALLSGIDSSHTRFTVLRI